jgi:hypothetical protein
VTSDARLAQIITALESAGVTCLVMGGHAVRYFGVERNTNDFDLHVAPAHWNDLSDRLRSAAGQLGTALVEGPSWRPHTFRRFQIGVLPSGREEWLEFWKENHLLAPFDALYGRREAGEYGGRCMNFLSLPDLIRSKETERESDWQDIAQLEEFHDARQLSRADKGEIEIVAALSELRSRRGYELHLQRGNLTARAAVEQALRETRIPMSQAFLLPSAPAFENLPPTAVAIDPVIVERLRRVPPTSPLHLALVEAVRRQYKLAAQTADRADKQSILSLVKEPE